MMSSKYAISFVVAAAVIAAACFFFFSSQPQLNAMVFDGRNSSFAIDGKSVSLHDGIFSVPAAPGSAAMDTVRYFGNDATGDLNGDGYDDAAFLVTEDTGGSGTFYYAVAALGSATGYKTTNAFFIGDRIAPQSTKISASARELRVNYAERKPGEPMSDKPSVGATLYLKVTSAGILEGLMK